MGGREPPNSSLPTPLVQTIGLRPANVNPTISGHVVAVMFLRTSDALSAPLPIRSETQNGACETARRRCTLCHSSLGAPVALSKENSTIEKQEV